MPIIFKKRAIKRARFTLRQYHERRNKVLVIRNSRGIGDILMHRMAFDDFKRVMPDAEIVFATQPQYHDVAGNHPAVSGVADCNTVDVGDYVVSYNNSQTDFRWEVGHSPNANKNRADIWAEHCGVTLTTHDMHADCLPRGDYDDAEDRLWRVGYDGTKPKVCFCPVAHDALRTLTEDQMAEVLDELKDCFVYILHDKYPLSFRRFDVPVLKAFDLKDWMTMIDVADYVVSVDTASFHYAGGRGKPLCGIFTYADGKYRGQYYDFILVQRHRDDGDWKCGPCYNWMNCSHPEEKSPTTNTPKPCLLKLTGEHLREGVRKMFARWPR